MSEEAKREKVKTKEEQQEEKRIAMSIRIKPLDLDGNFHIYCFMFEIPSVVITVSRYFESLFSSRPRKRRIEIKSRRIVAKYFAA